MAQKTDAKNTGAVKPEAKNTAAKKPAVKKTAAKKEEKDPEVAIETAIGRTENFIMKNGRTLLTILGVIVVLAGGYFGYKYMVEVPRGQKASAMMFVAQQYFAEDQFQIALAGDGNYDGFLAVAEKYGSTPEGNLAKHYAGICYIRLGDYDQALAYLQKYKAVKGIPSSLVNAQNLGLQGDAYAQQGNLKEALAMYEKAANTTDNSFTTPYYLKKAGMVYEQQGEAAKAAANYKRILSDYPTSLEAQEIQKNIGAAEQQL